jgi:4-amino-4-deoxy-L-arabinose transferase-like glycosyltransferase
MAHVHQSGRDSWTAPDDAGPADKALAWQLSTILLFALLLRLGYQTAMLWYGGSYHNSSDSEKYLEVAHAILAHGTYETDRAPLYMFFLTLIIKIAGSESLRAVVSVQAALDTLSVLAIAFSARAFGRALVIPAALVAAIIPNFLVHSAYILSETLFLFFFAWGICAVLWAIRGRRPVLLLTAAGLAFGLALWTRLALTFFPLFLAPIVFIALRMEQKRSWLGCAALTAIPLAVMWVSVLPLLAYNYATYGYAALTSQQGGHLLVVYSCVASAWPCSDRLPALHKVEAIVNAHAATIGGANANPFALGAYRQKVAVEHILQLPLGQIAWGWTWGAFKNLMQTSFYQVLSQFNQPLTFFSTTRAPTTAGRIFEFIATNWNHPFMVMWTVSQVALVFSRTVQVFGLVIGLFNRQFCALTLVLLGVIAYFLAVNGPIADPKYRIPFEPPLILLFALGLTQSNFLRRLWSAPVTWISRGLQSRSAA